MVELAVEVSSARVEKPWFSAEHELGAEALHSSPNPVEHCKAPMSLSTGSLVGRLTISVTPPHRPGTLQLWVPHPVVEVLGQCWVGQEMGLKREAEDSPGGLKGQAGRRGWYSGAVGACVAGQCSEWRAAFPA